ncbi:MAG: bifunctional adenosylcobinamide kinase/adenosylcobinamide-phosphate guanylyltransferase [Firmicutes bacterium]|nr:bifunctional adenosylcobinamide kinase/adenosylcobinamide-phosphate guanylyltransferase [Bacillota bacterium]
MILVFGGAYQGKLDYVKKNYNPASFCDCSESLPDFDADVIYGLENFVMRCVESGDEAADFFREKKELWSGDKILVLTDASQGVVPVSKNLRDFREMNGRLMIYLAGEADKVIRVFCGIGKQVK